MQVKKKKKVIIENTIKYLTKYTKTNVECRFLKLKLNVNENVSFPSLDFPHQKHFSLLTKCKDRK